MSITYSFVADGDFYRTAFARHRQQHPTRRRRITVFLATGMILLLASIYGGYIGAVWTSIPEYALMGGIAGGLGTYAVAKILFPIRIKRSPGFGAIVSVILDGEGLHATESQAKATFGWPYFTRIAHFADGILLIRGNVVRWLPDSALRNSTPDEAVRFVRSQALVVDVV